MESVSAFWMQLLPQNAGKEGHSHLQSKQTLVTDKEKRPHNLQIDHNASVGSRLLCGRQNQLQDRFLLQMLGTPDFKALKTYRLLEAKDA